MFFEIFYALNANLCCINQKDIFLSERVKTNRSLITLAFLTEKRHEPDGCGVFFGRDPVETRTPIDGTGIHYSIH